MEPLDSEVKSLGLDRKRNERLMPLEIGCAPDGLPRFHGSPGHKAVNLQNGQARDPSVACSLQVMYPENDKNPVYAIKRGGFDDRLCSQRCVELMTYGKIVFYPQTSLLQVEQCAGDVRLGRLFRSEGHISER